MDTGILIVSGISFLCCGIFFNTFVLPSITPQEARRDIQKEKMTQPTSFE